MTPNPPEAALTFDAAIKEVEDSIAAVNAATERLNAAMADLQARFEIEKAKL